MSDCNDILISLAPIYARAILNGNKTVELRRRRIHVREGTRIWIYSKLPVGSIEATAIVERICLADPESIWSEFHQTVGITKAAFNEYFDGCSRGCAVVLRDVSPVNPTMELAQLRTAISGFHPPQFFKRLRRDHIEGFAGRLSP